MLLCRSVFFYHLLNHVFFVSQILQDMDTDLQPKQATGVKKLQGLKLKLAMGKVLHFQNINVFLMNSSCLKFLTVYARECPHLPITRTPDLRG